MGAIAESWCESWSTAGATLILVDIKPEEAARQTLREWKIPAVVLHLFLSRHYRFRRTEPGRRRILPAASLPWTRFSATPAVAACILSLQLPRPTTTAFSVSTILPRSIWRAPSSRNGSSARLPAISSSLLPTSRACLIPRFLPTLRPKRRWKTLPAAWRWSTRTPAFA